MTTFDKQANDHGEQHLRELFCSWAGFQPDIMEQLPRSGSNRRYYRMAVGTKSAIGTIGENDRENAAFLSFSESLAKAGVRVPAIYAVDRSSGIYLQQDLGNTSLYGFLVEERKANDGRFTSTLKEIYKKVLAAMAEIHNKGRQVIDFDACYPRAAFDEQSMMWDLQYFKYYFLKLAGVGFDEELLERDFRTFIKYLLETNCKYFLYRDMQSRNVMLDNDLTPWFIDYQGGRRGARQYDVASLLYDAKADIPPAVRNELLSFYVSRLQNREVDSFLRHFYGYCLIRIMQAMGAYGYRGYFERKEHFLKSIPFALDNMRDIIKSHELPIDIPELSRVWSLIANSRKLRCLDNETKPLTVVVTSFSYKHGIPVDVSGNGGGFVFDCRCLPNPGREDRYRDSTGRDADVLAFFTIHREEMDRYMQCVYNLLRVSVENYLDRRFTNLMVNFGCTGGQHRSVYCAEAAAQWLRITYGSGVEVCVRHTESINNRQPRR